VLESAGLEPTFFGKPQLFGIYHAASVDARGRSGGVLLCPPIGHEHTRSHRALKTLAESLARAGHHVLRFDYRGLGDSSGEFADGGPGPWCQDIVQALGELEALSGIREAHIVGLRLGATLAAAALARDHARPGRARVEHLVLWDPILSGEEFLGVATGMASEFLNDPSRLPARARGSGRRVPTEVLLGYSYSDELRRSLCQIDLRRLDPWPVVLTSFVLSEPSGRVLDLTQRIRASGRSATCDVVEDSDRGWAVYESHEKTLRAGRVIHAILARLGADRA
jgi:pimeloyl-ACP methyl ester carboxylesterase